MIAALDRWIRRDLQRLARKHLGSPITTISVMSSYSCRNAYGRTSTRLSEHAKANALDIGGFVTADGKSTRLLAHWGPTKRDLAAEAKRLAEAQSEREASIDTQPKKAKHPSPAAAKKPKSVGGNRTSREPGTKPEKDTAAALLPELPERRPSLRQRLLWAKAERNQSVLEQTRKSREAYRRGFASLSDAAQQSGRTKAGAGQGCGQDRPRRLLARRP